MVYSQPYKERKTGHPTPPDARESKDPTNLANALFFDSWLSGWLGEFQRAEAMAAQSLAICDEHDMTYQRHITRHRLGWARAQLGRASEGVSLVREGISGVIEMGSRGNLTEVLTRFAETQALNGEVADAFLTFESAFNENPREQFYRPDILTCRGELRLKQGQTELAEADLREAIALAQKLSAKAFELRAATSLARLLQARGEISAARDLLAPVYAWFSESFDTRDLIAAKSLLYTLNARSGRDG